MSRVHSAFLALSALLALSATAQALDVPPTPRGRVSDFAGVLSTSDREALEAQLAAYTEGSTRQYAVALFKSLEGESLEDFSIRLADAWKIGGKASSDGVLMSVFMAEHKIRVEVGYGLEDKLTDVFCGRLISDTIAPAFRRGDIGGGLSQAFADIDYQVTGEHRAVAGVPPQQADSSMSDFGFYSGIFFLIALFVVATILNRRGGGRGGFSAGSALGGGGWSSGSGGGGGGGGFGGGGFGGGGGGFGGGGASGGW